MKTFTLTASYNVLRSGITEVCLKPSDKTIQYYLATYKAYDTEDEAIADTANFIADQTPLLYQAFQNSDNVQLTVKSQYQL
jgi:hypothetical protein